MCKPLKGFHGYKLPHPPKLPTKNVRKKVFEGFNECNVRWRPRGPKVPQSSRWFDEGWRTICEVRQGSTKLRVAPARKILNETSMQLCADSSRCHGILLTHRLHSCVRFETKSHEAQASSTDLSEASWQFWARRSSANPARFDFALGAVMMKMCRVVWSVCATGLGEPFARLFGPRKPKTRGP